MPTVSPHPTQRDATSDAITRYLRHLRLRRRAESTITTYRQVLEHLDRTMNPAARPAHSQAGDHHSDQPGCSPSRTTHVGSAA